MVEQADRNKKYYPPEKEEVWADRSGLSGAVKFKSFKKSMLWLAGTKIIQC